MVRNRSGLVLAFILLVAIFLRVYPLAVEAVDGDELFSRRAVMGSWEQGFQIVRADLVHPPLFYVALKTTMAVVGQDMFGMRSASLLAGMVLISAVFAIGWAVPYLRGPAVLASVLIAFNDLHIFYSQQTRSYALYSALVGLLVLWAFLLDEYQSRAGFWAIGAVLMSAIVHTHYFGVLFIGCVLIPLWYSKLPARTKISSLTAATVAALSFIPWLVILLGAVKEKGKVDNVNWEPLPKFYALRGAIGRLFGIPDIPGGTTLVVLIGFVLALIGIVTARRHVPGRLLSMLALIAVGPLILLFVLGQPPFELHVFADRHLLPSIIAWTLLAALGLWGLRSALDRRFIIPVGAVLLCALQLAPVVQYWMKPHRHPFNQVAAKVAGSHVPVFTTWPYGIGDPVNFCLRDDRRVEPLPVAPAQLPSEFIVLHRPNAKKEQDWLGAAVNGSYERTDDGYYTAPMNAEWGTRISHFRRK